MSRYYQGIYKPKNKDKYLGDPANIVYRSFWELRVLRWLDTDSNVLRYASEEIVVPYVSPKDGKVHRYFPDFYFEKINESGKVEKFLVEVKPHGQTQKPKSRKNTKRYINEAVTYAVNQAKWKAAEEWCLDRGIKFRIVTEKDLGNLVG